MGGQSTRLTRGCCCCQGSDESLTQMSGSGADGYTTCNIAGHSSSCRCQSTSSHGGPRRYISGVDATASDEYAPDGAPENEQMEQHSESDRRKHGGSTIHDQFDDSDLQKGPAALYDTHHHPHPPSTTTSTPHQNRGRGRHRLDNRDQDDGDTGDDADDDPYGYRHDFDSDEPVANNLSESQIQQLIQQQVARLNARLNELDEELAAEEEDCEHAAEVQEQQEQQILAASPPKHHSTHSNGGREKSSNKK